MSQGGTSSTGGAMSQGGTSPTGGTSAQGGDAGAATVSIDGSYTLVFQTATLAQPMPSLVPVSVGVDNRLDLRKAVNGSYDALFTSHFEQTYAMSGYVSGGALSLIGPASISGSTEVGYVTDSWQQLVLEVDATGGLTGVVTASGMSTGSEGDVAFESDVSGTAQISADHVAPELKATFGDPAGPPNAMLPWDPIQLATSEGVDEKTLAASASITFGDGEPMPMFTSITGPDSTDPTAWGGARTDSLLLASWTPMGQETAQVNVVAGDKDPSGNLSAAFHDMTTLLPVGPALASHTFQGDVVEEATWGTIAFLGSKSGSDPHCENAGACVELGPFHTGNNPCEAPVPTGVAGLLQANAGSSVTVRYKVTTKGLGDGNPPSLYPAPFEVVLATHEAGIAISQVMVAPTDFVDQGEAAGDERWATVWTTATYAAPASFLGGEIGFEVRAPYFDPCGGGLGPPQAPTQVYIGAVGVQP
jgi:hypothetical protein